MQKICCLLALSLLIALLEPKPILAVGNYLADRNNYNVIGAGVGAKILLTDDKINNIGKRKILPLCFDVFYMRYLAQYVGLGIEYEFCQATVSDASTSTRFKEIKQTTSSGFINLGVGFPFRNRVVDGLFSDKNFEFGFIASVGSAKLDLDTVDGLDKNLKDSVSGVVGKLALFFDLGADMWGLRLSVTQTVSGYPEFKKQHKDTLTSTEINKSQRAPKVGIALIYVY